MIIAHKHLIEYVANGRIHCKPFDEKYVGVNSIDVHLGDTIKIIQPNDCVNGLKFINPRLAQRYQEVKISPEKGWIVRPCELILGHTIEEIGSDHFVPLYSGRSSIARMGLFSEVSAGFGEIGFKKQWTLEFLAPAHPVLIYPGMKIGQVYFEEASDTSVIYGRDIAAHYADQSGPVESKFADDARIVR